MGLFHIGLIINPLAGLGGPAGFKGSDGMAEQALALGVEPKAAQRTRTALEQLLTLRERIDSMLYERTALSSQPEQTIANELSALRRNQQLSPGLVLRAPYVLDFLGLKECWDEQELEGAILREMQGFLLELGAGFSFVARQKRIQIDDDDFHLDLLFYNRKLRRLLVVELKQGSFKSEYKGQMELYLKWLDKHERQTGEEAPIGLILCAESSREQVELLQMHKDGITVAEYWTELPPKAELEQLLGRGVDLVEPGAVRNPYVLASINRHREPVYAA